MGTSRAAKAASHDRILDIAAARFRRDGIDRLAVAEIMKEAGLTHGGFYRHFDSREQLVAEAAQRALSLGSAWTMAAGKLGGERGYTALVDGYLSTWHRDHPESGCGVAGVAADAARDGGPARGSYTRQVKECLAVWPTSSATPTAKRENAKRSSPSASSSARSPWPGPSTTLSCLNR